MQLINPFVFRNGQTASTIADLAQLCRQYPGDGVYHLENGHIESWLKYIGKSDLAKSVRSIWVDFSKPPFGDKDKALETVVKYCFDSAH